MKLRAFINIYEQSIPCFTNLLSNSLPSNQGLPSIITTLNFFPASCASQSIL